MEEGKRKLFEWIKGERGLDCEDRLPRTDDALRHYCTCASCWAQRVLVWQQSRSPLGLATATTAALIPALFFGGRMASISTGTVVRGF